MYSIEYSDGKGAPQFVPQRDETHYSWDRIPTDCFFTPAWNDQKRERVKTTLYSLHFFPRDNGSHFVCPIWTCVPRYFENERYTSGAIPVLDFYLCNDDGFNGEDFCKIYVDKRKINPSLPWKKKEWVKRKLLWCEYQVHLNEPSISKEIAAVAKRIREIGEHSPDIGEWQGFAFKEFGDIKLLTKAEREDLQKQKKGIKVNISTAREPKDPYSPLFDGQIPCEIRRSLKRYSIYSIESIQQCVPNYNKITRVWKETSYSAAKEEHGMYFCQSHTSFNFVHEWPQVHLKKEMGNEVLVSNHYYKTGEQAHFIHDLEDPIQPEHMMSFPGREMVEVSQLQPTSHLNEEIERY